MRCLPVSLLLLSIATPAAAQQPERLPFFVFDARGAFTVFKADPITAKDLGITAADLATHGFGIVGGAHIYPLRRANWALGLGGELLLAGRARQRFGLLEEPLGPEVQRRLRNVSGQLSLNFGHRDGWSYLTAGMGPLSFDTFLTDTIPDGARQMTQNYGFGARWFGTPHAAFNIDMRFYLTQPADTAVFVGGRERRTILVLSAGVSLK